MKKNGSLLRQFEADTRQHEIHIIHEEGGVTHLEYAKPGASGSLSVDVVKFPGHLCISSPKGTYVFAAREENMLKCFHCKSLPLEYWEEKCVSIGRGGIRRFSKTDFDECVVDFVNNYIESDADEKKVQRRAVGFWGLRTSWYFMGGILMNFQGGNKDLKMAAAQELCVCADSLKYYAYPQVFPSTSGPFPGVGCRAVCVFTIEAWVKDKRAALFCDERFWKVVEDFNPGNAFCEKISSIEFKDILNEQEKLRNALKIADENFASLQNELMSIKLEYAKFGEETSEKVRGIGEEYVTECKRLAAENYGLREQLQMLKDTVDRDTDLIGQLNLIVTEIKGIVEHKRGYKMSPDVSVSSFVRHYIQDMEKGTECTALAPLVEGR